jgi:hypothetical protein
VQAEFLRSKATIRGFVGGRGAGKSWIGAMDLLTKAEPRKFYFAGAPTYGVLEDATWRTLTEIAKSWGLYAGGAMSPRPKMVLRNGAEIIGRSADEPERFRGPNLSAAWLDEASQVNREAFDLLFPCLREGGKQGWLTGTFTPRGRAHWTYKVFASESTDCQLFKARTADNPFLPEGFDDLIRQRYVSQFAAQELDAEFLEGFQEQIPERWLRYFEMQGEIIRILNRGGGVAEVVDQRELQRFATIDTAGSSKDKAEEAKGKVAVEKNNASWSVCAVWDYWRQRDILILRHVWRGRVSWPELKLRTAATLDAFGVKKTIIENATVGHALCAELSRFGSRTVPTVIPGMSEGVGQRGAKLERAIASGLLKRAEDGKLVIPTAGTSHWVKEYIDEVTSWTGEPSETADQIDVSSYAAYEVKDQCIEWGGVVSPSWG